MGASSGAHKSWLSKVLRAGSNAAWEELFHGVGGVVESVRQGQLGGKDLMAMTSLKQDMVLRALEVPELADILPTTSMVQYVVQLNEGAMADPRRVKALMAHVARVVEEHHERQREEEEEAGGGGAAASSFGGSIGAMTL